MEGMGARLVFRDVHGQDGSIQLGASPVYVGRGTECAVRTDDAMVSRRHSALEKTADGWLVRDLGSSNGTLLNDRRITEPERLRHGDVLRCGSLWMRYQDDAPAGQERPLARADNADALTLGRGATSPEWEMQCRALADRIAELNAQLAQRDAEIATLRSALERVQELAERSLGPG